MDANLDQRWWLKSSKPHEVIWGVVDHLEKNDGSRRSLLLRHMRLYGNMEFRGYGPADHDTPVSSERVTMNLVKSAVDAVVSRVFKNLPRPVFLTRNGNASMRRRAQTLERFVEAQMYTSGMRAEARKMLLDAALLGKGALFVYCDKTKKRAGIERVFPGELFVPTLEGLYGKPRQIHRRRYVDRGVLKEQFPQHAKAIENASPLPDVEEYYDVLLGRDEQHDQLEVIESWHIASGPKASDGRHVICIEGTTLLSEPWEKDYLPFVFLSWSERIRGFWSQGLGYELTGLQVEINRLLQKVQQAFHLMAVPRIFVERGSGVNTAQLNNAVGGIVQYTGAPPVVQSPQTMHPEVFAHLDRLWNRGFEIAGIGPLNATSQVPAGMESGAALREYSDIGDIRLATFFSDWEEAWLETARRIVDVGRDLWKDDPKFSVVAYKDRYSIQQVKWKDVDLDTDAYVLKVMPSSSLPGTPAGRLAAVEQLLGMGLIEGSTGLRLLNFPDLDYELSLDRAANDHLDNVIEKILDEGVYTTPEPFDDPVLALKKVQAALNRAQLDEDVPYERLEMLRKFLAQTADNIRKTQMQAQAPNPLVNAGPAPDASGAPLTAVQSQGPGTLQ